MTILWRPRTWLLLVLLVSLAGLLVAQVPTYPRLRWGGGHSGVLAEVSSAGEVLVSAVSSAAAADPTAETYPRVRIAGGTSGNLAEVDATGRLLVSSTGGGSGGPLAIDNTVTGTNSFSVTSTSNDGSNVRFSIENNAISPVDVNFRRVVLYYGEPTSVGVTQSFYGNAFYAPLNLYQIGSSTNLAWQINSNGTTSSYTKGLAGIAYYLGGYGEANGIYQLGADDGTMSWGPGGATPFDTFLARTGAATLTLGGANAASPVAQTLGAQGGSGTNIAGGALTLRPGIGTGTAVPAPVVVGASVLGTASGTGAQAQVTRHTFGTTKILTDAAAIAIVQATLANGSVHASRYQYAVEVTNGTDFQIEEGLATCHVTNKAGAIANNTCVKASNQQAMTAGTLTVTFAISAANPAVISINADSSLTPSAGYPRVTYELVNLTQQAVVVQ